MPDPRPPRPDAAPCGRRFPEELLSGYLDGALNQHDEQRVRLHLEDCEVCRAEIRELSDIREVTMSTRFPVPDDRQWSEAPRGAVSRWSRRLGWWLIILWAVAVTVYALWELAHSPEDLVVKTLVFGGLLGGAFLFVSILLDRLRALPGDRYRGVDK